MKNKVYFQLFIVIFTIYSANCMQRKENKKKYKIFPANKHIYHDLAEFCLERDFAPAGKLRREFKERSDNILANLQERIDQGSLKVKILSKNDQIDDFLAAYLPRMYFLFGNAHKQNLEPIFCIDITPLQELHTTLQALKKKLKQYKQQEKKALKPIIIETPVNASLEVPWYKNHHVYVGITALTCLSVGWCAHMWWHNRK